VYVGTDGKLGTITSSRRYKENITDLSDYSILSLRPVEFNYIVDTNKTRCLGLIAEEVEEVIPQLVIYKDGVPETVKYHELPILLLQGIQKLNQEIKQLQQRVRDLEV
jgi:hypothetical protein